MDKVIELQSQEPRKELLRNKVFVVGKITLSLAPYEKNMKKVKSILSRKSEKTLEGLMIKALPAMGYTDLARQFKVNSGRIDICAHLRGDLIGFELSVTKEDKGHLRQILSYLIDLNDMNPNGRNRIIMVAPDYHGLFIKVVEDQNARFLETGGGYIELWTYQIEEEFPDYVTLIKGHEPMYNHVPIYTKEEARSLGYQSFDLQSWRKGKRAWELAGMPERVGKHIPFMTINVPFREDLDFKQDIESNPPEQDIESNPPTQDIENNPPVSIISRIKNYLRARGRSPK